MRNNKNKMYFKLIFLIFVVINANEECTLEKLYQDIDVQLVLREHLTILFQTKIDQVLHLAKNRAPYLIIPAEHFRRELKKHFIEYGDNLNTIKELEKLLKKFNYLDIPQFKTWKEDFEKRQEFIRD